MSRTTSFVATVVTGVVFVGASVVGWNLMTAKPDVDEAAPCTPRHVAAGEPLTANLVKVNVLNASGRSGLANRVSINLQRLGFLAGTVGNSDSEIAVDHVAIFTDTPDDPMVQLVALQFQVAPQVVAPDISVGDGVTVVVGPNYGDLNTDGITQIESPSDVDVCVPVTEL